MPKTQDQGSDRYAKNSDRPASPFPDHGAQRSGPEKKRYVLAGEGLSGGMALGKVFLYTDILTRDLQVYNINKNSIEDEMGRIHSAMEQVMEDLDEQKHFAPDQAGHVNEAIFDFHKEVLKDKQLNIDIAEELESELINAEIVVKNVFRKLAKKLRSSKHEVIRSKAEDLEDLSRKIIRILVGYESNILEILPSDSIIVARRLLPSDTVHMKREHLRGIVVEEGSQYSHSALLARAFGITAVANVKDALRLLHNGEDLLIDGQKGTVIVRPNEEDLKEYEAYKRRAAVNAERLAQRRDEPARTKCGKAVKIYANAFSRKDFELARNNGCDGVGLLRLEQLYMAFKHLPDEDDIYNELNETLALMPDKQLTIRLLDIGGDKTLAYLKTKKERNPFLGIRGVRFLLKHPEILKTQLRAVIRLSDVYPVRVLIPMVTMADEIVAIRDMVKGCSDELKNETGKPYPDINIGPMIETPAAWFSIDEISEHSDFLSIGTNDLIQYVMAAGRENADVAEYYEKGVGIMMDIIARIVEVGRAKNIEVNVCGELASDLRQTEELLKQGIRNFSVSPSVIPELKEQISKVDLVEMSASGGSK